MHSTGLMSKEELVTPVSLEGSQDNLWAMDVTEQRMAETDSHSSADDLILDEEEDFMLGTGKDDPLAY